jgi:nicotinamide-nucleotide amidase
MNAEILAVGTELLMGQITNTNARHISSRLPDLGINVFFHTVAGDNPERLKSALGLALGRSDIVIMTGGLGPTMDDLTKETVSDCMGRPLVLHEDSLARIKERMAKFGGRRMPASNSKQAYFPEGAVILPNENGTAPGCIVEDGGKTVVMLPGPPSEMCPMFDDQVLPFFMKYAEYCLKSKYVRVFGIGESMLEEMLKDLIEAQTNPTLATYAKEGEVTLRVTARYRNPAFAGAGGAGAANGAAGAGGAGGADGADGADAPAAAAAGAGEAERDILAPVVDEVLKRVGANAYSTEDQELAEVALNALAERGKTLALAESCTGGLAASRLTDIPGASRVLLMSAVTYSNEAKMSALGVKASTLQAFGAVSAETAREMAIGARKAFGSDMAVSVTGIAGPGGGTDEKPVGLVHLALADSAGVRSKEIRAVGPRSRIRNVSCLHAFDMIRRAACGLPWIG